ncbi:hypothetical protein ACFLZZ_01735 [Nanoarchaeota archaeon]
MTGVLKKESYRELMTNTVSPRVSNYSLPKIQQKPKVGAGIYENGMKYIALGAIVGGACLMKAENFIGGGLSGLLFMVSYIEHASCKNQREKNERGLVERFGLENRAGDPKLN